MARRDGAACFYCRTPADPLSLTVDHYLPRRLYDCSRSWNLVLACFACNQAKGCRLPWPLVWVLLATYRPNLKRAA